MLPEQPWFIGALCSFNKTRQHLTGDVLLILLVECCVCCVCGPLANCWEIFRVPHVRIWTLANYVFHLDWQSQLTVQFSGTWFMEI